MIKPKQRIKQVFQKTLENGGNVTKAMRENKYTEATINNPINVTGTKSWEMLLEEYLPDTLLTKVTLEGLGATRIQTSPTEGDKVVEDYAVRQRYLDTALKMKGKIIDKKDITSNGKELQPVLVKFIDEDNRNTN